MLFGKKTAPEPEPEPMTRVERALAAYDSAVQRRDELRARANDPVAEAQTEVDRALQELSDARDEETRRIQRQADAQRDARKEQVRLRQIQHLNRILELHRELSVEFCAFTDALDEGGELGLANTDLILQLNLSAGGPRWALEKAGYTRAHGWGREWVIEVVPLRKPEEV